MKFIGGVLRLVRWSFLVLAGICAFAANDAAASPYKSAGPTTAYTLAADNGVQYVYLAEATSPCANGRLEVRDSAPYSVEYARRLYALLLSANARGKAVTFTWDLATAPNCVLNSILVAN